MPRLRTFVVALIALLGATAALPGAPSASAASVPLKTYYVDCSAGSDSNAGTSKTAAWRTMAKANAAPVTAGTALLFKRGCTWSGTRLTVGWSGTATDPVVIGSYGEGALPRIRNGLYSNVRVTGSYVTVKEIEVSSDFPTKVGDNGCLQPIGNVYGFDFTLGAHHNTLTASVARSMTAGVHISSDSHHITVSKNTFAGNSALQTFGGDPNLDLGAWGALINGNDNELVFNQFQSNVARCTNKGAPPASNALEIFGGSRNKIHHNRSTGERFFAELGGNATYRPDGNSFSYNLMVSDLGTARFLVTRGVGDSFGPVWRTTAVRNTVYLSGPLSDAVVCGKGCSPDILTLQNNVIYSSNKGVYADAAFNESRNVFWAASGKPLIQIPGGLSTTSRIADPMFTTPGVVLSLRPGSPGIDAGTSAFGFAKDIVLKPSLAGASPDLGAFESG